MANNYFNFKEFTVFQERSAFKVGTDGVLLGAVADITGKKNILDIGTGTGLISLMIAQRCDAQISAIESDNESFSEALENIKKSRWSSRITVLNSDLQNYFPGEKKFDLIVSNPPFFNDSLKNPDPRKSTARHNDNLTATDLLTGVCRLLSINGILQVIMPYAEGNLLIVEAVEFGLYCSDILKIKPLPTSEIRRLILTFKRERMKTKERFMTIERGPRHEFTEDYVNLTKDFYLKF
jgi:tRNA1Val (adenine37-N6)-methyltransferase